MLDWSGISSRSFLGKALRFPLRIIPDSLEVRIIQGPLRGKRWVAGSSNHGCWLGSYEFEKQRQMTAAVRPGMICFDIGANVGFYTLLFSELAGPQGTVVAFEPVPANCRTLRRHAAMNRCANVVVREIALTDFDSTARFDPSESNCQGHLSEAGPLLVKCARIDSLIADGQISPPDIMKIDVEGAEATVLAGAAQVLARKKPLIFLATHGESAREECRRILERLSYRLAPISGTAVESCDEFVARPR